MWFPDLQIKPIRFYTDWLKNGLTNGLTNLSLEIIHQQQLLRLCCYNQDET